MAVPKHDDLFNPVLRALRELGGSGNVGEINDKVADILGLSEKDNNEIHRGNTTKLSYRAAWARNYLKRYGLIENSSRGVWSLTAKGKSVKEVDKAELNRAVKSISGEQASSKIIENVDEPEAEILSGWEDEMLAILKSMRPDAFERLCQRILREAAFSEVTVEGRSGDGGIDGRGIFKIGGLIGIRVIFQSKRYANSISPAQIREFKGTMSGRAEKGLYITTGTYTRAAREEATRDGSMPIDLVDGEGLVQLLKEMRLGCEVKQVEEIEVDRSWFDDL